MASDLPEIAVCEDCGCVNERATAQLDEAKEQVALLERDLRAKRSKIKRLESDRWASLRSSQKYEDAMVVLRHWRDTCAPRAREIDSAERLEKVLARLGGGATVDELKLCASGYAKFPYVTKGGRSPNGSPSEWHADAELIYRTPEHVRKGIALASSTSSRTSGTFQDIAKLPWRRVWQENRKLIIQALTEQFPAMWLHNDLGWRMYPCPKCTVDDYYTLPLRVADEPRWEWLAECTHCGLDDTRLLAAIQEDK